MTVDPIIAGSIAWAIVFGVASGWLAHRRDRIVLAWVLFGAILGPVGLVLLWAAPPGRCASCRAPVRGWQTECEWCGMDVRGRSAAERSAERPIISVAPTLRPAIDRAQPIANPSAPPTKATKRKATKATKASGAADRTAAAVAPPAVSTDPPAPASASASASASAKSEPAAAAPAAAAGRRASPAKAAVVDGATTRRDQQVVTSGVYVTGTVGLSAGSRYTIAHDGVDLQVLGPSDRSPKKIAYERALEGVDATAPEDRLILTAAGGRGGTVLVFMSVEGDPARIAGELSGAARAAGAAS